MSKKIAIMQPYFFPYIGYFQLIKAVDTFVIYDDVNYIKRGWINRNSILINGKTHLFKMNLKAVSQNKLINEILLEENSSWKNNLLKTITMSYKKAPYFDDVYPLLKDIIMYYDQNLSLFLQNLIVKICHYLKVETSFILSSKINKTNKTKGQDKIIEICRELEAKQYINPIGGVELYNKKIFLEEEIQLNFIETQTIKYNQFVNDFIPNLSIIDVMMFNTVENIDEMLNSYKLI